MIPVEVGRGEERKYTLPQTKVNKRGRRGSETRGL